MDVEDDGPPEDDEVEYLDDRVSTHVLIRTHLQTSRQMKILWRNFYRGRGGSKRRAMRSMPLEKLLGFIQDIYEVRYRLEQVRMRSLSIT